MLTNSLNLLFPCLFLPLHFSFPFLNLIYFYLDFFLVNSLPSLITLIRSSVIFSKRSIASASSDSISMFIPLCCMLCDDICTIYSNGPDRSWQKFQIYQYLMYPGASRQTSRYHVIVQSMMWCLFVFFDIHSVWPYIITYTHVILL